MTTSAVLALLAHDSVPDGLPASSKGPTEQQIHRIGGTRYLVVDQTANRRHGSKVSKIWQYGMISKKPFLPCNAGPSMYSPAQQHPANASEPLAVQRKLITPERNLLGDNITEALEYLRAWWNNGLIKRL